MTSKSFYLKCYSKFSISQFYNDSITLFNYSFIEEFMFFNAYVRNANDEDSHSLLYTLPTFSIQWENQKPLLLSLLDGQLPISAKTVALLMVSNKRQAVY